MGERIELKSPVKDSLIGYIIDIQKMTLLNDLFGHQRKLSINYILNPVLNHDKN